MKKIIRFYDIQWDTDGVLIDSLPEETTIEVDNDTDVSLEGADILSDKFGWCVDSFSFKEI